MKNVLICAADYDNISQVHQELAEKLGFPPYYGANLDALYDVLTEADEAMRIEISFEGAEDPSMIHALLDMINVMMEAEKENKELTLVLKE